jgi:hypothetical protein
VYHLQIPYDYVSANVRRRNRAIAADSNGVGDVAGSDNNRYSDNTAVADQNEISSKKTSDVEVIHDSASRDIRVDPNRVVDVVGIGNNEAYGVELEGSRRHAYENIVEDL